MTLENRVTLAMAPHIKLANLGEIIRSFSEEFPSVDVQIRAFTTAEIQQLIVDGVVDLGVILEPEGIPQALDFLLIGHSQAGVCQPSRRSACSNVVSLLGRIATTSSDIIEGSR